MPPWVLAGVVARRRRSRAAGLVDPGPRRTASARPSRASHGDPARSASSIARSIARPSQASPPRRAATTAPRRAAAHAIVPASPASATDSSSRRALTTSPAARWSSPRATGAGASSEPRRVARPQDRLPDEPAAQGPDPVGRRHRDRVEPGGDALPLAPRGVRRARRPEHGLGADVAVDRGRPAAVVARPAGRREGDPRVVALDGGRDRVHPSGALGRRETLALAAEQPSDRHPVLGAAVRPQRLGERPVRLEDVARARVPGPRPGLADLLDQHPVEVLAQDLVVAEGAVVVLDGHGEHAAARELVEQRAAPRRVAQPVAHGPGQPAEDAGVDEEPAQVLGQPEQHVLRQVLAQEPAARLGAGEDPSPLVRATARGSRGGTAAGPRPSPRCGARAPRGRPAARGRGRCRGTAARPPTRGTGGRPARARGARPTPAAAAG